MQISATPNQFKNLSVFYTLTDSHGIVVFTGVCKWEEVLTLKAPRKKHAFFQNLPPDNSMTITCLTWGTHEECKAAERVWLLQLLPSGKPWPSLSGYIICEQTSEVFESVTDAAKAHGVFSSAIYNHLNKRPGYTTVKDRTYARGLL